MGMHPNMRGRVWHHVDHPAIRVVPAQGSQPFSGNFMITRFRCAVSEAHHLVYGCYIVDEHRDVICDITAPHCISHMTFCYKRSADASLWALGLWFIHLSGSPLSPVCGWCLTRVGRDASSASPGWSLLPSNIIIVLALVNRYLNETQECCLTPCQYRFHRTAVPFGWCPCASW